MSKAQHPGGGRPGRLPRGRPPRLRSRPRWLPSWLRLPPVMRTLRWRLTALYGVLFLISGAVLLVISGGYVINRASVSAVAHGSHSGSAPTSTTARLANAAATIRQLQHELATQAGGAPSSLRSDLLVASAISLGFMTIGSVIMGWLLAGRALRPVRRMTAATRQISAHNLNERLAVSGPEDELKELGDTIDELLQRLETAFAAQRRFVANASHELRTPLTTMRASLDVAVGKPGGAPPQAIVLASRLRTELDRIDALLEAFLVLARAQHRNLPGYSVLPLDYIVGAALARQSEAIAARNLTVRNDAGPGGAWVKGSQALVSRMVENLIDNAAGHNVDGGWIHVRAQTEAGRARLTVENGGDVLDQAEVDELSQPFRRLGADRIGTDRGSGLGLSIVAAIAEAHGGRLELQARRGGGLRACVDLPAADPAADPAAASAALTGTVPADPTAIAGVRA
jgi:signal transduction histidine kinase